MDDAACREKNSLMKLEAVKGKGKLSVHKHKPEHDHMPKEGINPSV